MSHCMSASTSDSEYVSSMRKIALWNLSYLQPPRSICFLFTFYCLADEIIGVYGYSSAEKIEAKNSSNNGKQREHCKT